MAQIQSGVTVDLLTIDPTSKAARTTLYDATGTPCKVDSDGSLKVQVRAPAFGALGAYSKSLTSGIIVPTGSTNALIWAMRWTDSTGKLCLIERIRVNAVVTAAVTTGIPYNLQLFLARGFTVSPTTNIGTTATLTGGNGKRRTNMGTTLLGGMWILGTAAAGMTGQTLGNDTDALATIGGGISASAPIGQQFFGANPANLWDDNIDGYPIILAQNEGLAIQAPLAGPASGSHQVVVSVDWMEVAAY